MKVIKIKDVKEDKKIIQSNLEPLLLNYPIFIIDNKDELLYSFIEQLEIDGELLYRLRITKEIDFADTPVMLRNKLTDHTVKDNITCLSQLLEGLDEYIIKRCRLIVNTENTELMSEIIQAFIYLNIDIEIMMEKEKSDKEIVDAFRREFDKIRTSIIKAERVLRDYKVNNDFSEDKSNILSTLYSIEDDLEKARERELYISVMATKKAGKSVIVNSFLKEEFAPTSIELPTPNTCIYKRSEDEYIRLLYGNRDTLYKSARDIYKFIYNEFKKAQNDREKGYTIDAMKIYYPSSDNDFASFTIVDTPGSNYAVATDTGSGENSHKNNTYEWIKKSDVVLFVVNYSNYLSMDEEEFLKDIKSQFEKLDKFYSLIIVVNKLDEMYISECENKSAVRFLDYIRCKLNDLGYKGFVVMGTSARSYFDTLKIRKIDSDIMEASGETVPIENLRGHMLRERIKALKERFIGKAEMSALSFVDDQLEKLECFFGLENYSLDTLVEKSGMQGLMSYARHIAVRKAYTELYRFLIRSIDEKYVKIRNVSTVNSLIDSKKYQIDEIQEIENKLHNLINRFEAIKIGVEDNLGFEELRSKLSSDIKKSIDKRLQYILDLCETRIDEFFMKLMLKNSEQLRNIKNRTMDIDLSINNKIFIEELNTIIEGFLNALNNELIEKEKYIKEAEDRMKKVAESFSRAMRMQYELKNFDIAIPKLDSSFKRKLLNKMHIFEATDDIVKEKILESIEVSGSTVGKIFRNLMRNRYGFYTINSKQLKRVKDEYIDYIRNDINNEYYACYDLLQANLLECINKYDEQLKEVFNNIVNTYKNIIKEIIERLENSKKNAQVQLNYVDSKLQFFDEIDKINKDFIRLWNIVREASS